VKEMCAVSAETKEPIPTIVGNSGVSPFRASRQVLLAGHAGLPTAVDPMRADKPRRRAQLRPDISVPLAFPAPAPPLLESI
jgi:hypothetical protein